MPSILRRVFRVNRSDSDLRSSRLTAVFFLALTVTMLSLTVSAGDLGQVYATLQFAIVVVVVFVIIGVVTISLELAARARRTAAASDLPES